MKNVRCKNMTKRKNKDIEKVCDRHLLKIDDNGDIHVPCHACGHHAIISIVNNKLTVIHVNKQGENTLCRTKMM